MWPDRREFKLARGLCVPTPTIAKIRQLKNVGVLEDVAVDAFPLKFQKYNVIYGFNGSGNP